MDTNSLFGFPIEKLFLFLVAIVGTAWGLSAKYSGKFVAERTQTLADIATLRRDLEQRIDRDSGVFKNEIESLKTEVRSVPDKMRSEIERRIDPVNKGIEELKAMFNNMERDNRERFMDARDIKENRKADLEQMANLGVRVINAEAAAKNATNDVTGVMTTLAPLSKALSEIERHLAKGCS